jgi:hypothetical protein
MHLPGFTAEASLRLSNGTYRTRSWHGGFKPRIKPQYTPRPDRPPGRPPYPFPPLGPEDPSARPSYCDTRCLDVCQEMFRRECGTDSMCVLETMPVCRHQCCALL